MHVPNPLGGIPLILRDINVTNPRRGELLLDYTKADLYYVNKESGKKIRLADSIYQQLVAAKLENTKIEIVHSDSSESATEPVVPEVADRKPNTFYINVIRRSERPEESE